jgi:dihydrofolate reductase
LLKVGLLPIEPLIKTGEWVLNDRRSRGNTLSGEDIYVCKSLAEAISTSTLMFSAKNIFLIGGGTLYKEALASNIVDRVVATEIHKVYDGDTYFPALQGPWKSKLISRTDQFDILEYKKGINYEETRENNHLE